MPALISAEQESAIARRSEPLLLAAGAGSGKTAVLVERFVRAVLEDGLSPSSILAITFTESAAAEVKGRVRSRLLEVGERAAARDVGGAFVSTFHAFCARLLRSHPLSAGLEPQFAILDEAFALGMAEQAFAGALRLLLAGQRPDAVDLVAGYGPDRLRAMMLNLYAELRARGQSRPRLPRVSDGGAAQREAAHACELLDELLGSFGELYEARKRERGALDFDDLELRALELLREHESVRTVWSRRFELLMVDEFQDTNPRQLAILRALERENLFTVGDELQSIYGFRDADVGLFRARRAELAADARSMQLTRNFRSRPGLLEVINAVFEARLQGVYTPLVAAREGSERAGAADAADPEVELLLANRDGAGDGETARGRPGEQPAAPGCPPWRLAEARMLAGRVAELVDTGAAEPGQVAVLLRALGDAEVYERALRERGLQTLASVGGFWSSPPVRDMLAYLRALANPFDELALYATLAGPLVGLSSDGLVHLSRVATEARALAWNALKDRADELEQRLDRDDAARLTAFTRRFALERRQARGRSVARLIERATESGSHRAGQRARHDLARDVANERKLLRLARRFEASEGRDLRGFLDYAAHQQSAGAGEADAPVAGSEPQAVRVMSIHAAKGLEFDVVCIADLGRAPNLGVPDLLVDGARIGLRMARLDGREPDRALDFDALCEERRRAQAEEEERILYVAMTRARERLLLSGAVRFERWPDARLGAPPLAWLGPALSGQIPELARAHGEGAQDAVHHLRAGAAARLSVRMGAVCHERAAASSHRPASSDEEPSRQPPDHAIPPPSSQAKQATLWAEPPTPETMPLTPQAEEHRRSAVPDPLEGMSALSYSALDQLERCGYRFYLERVLGLGEEPPLHADAGGERLQARARGTLVHRLLESIDFARPVAPAPRRIAALAHELGMRPSRGECERISALARAMLLDDAPACTSLRSRLADATQTRREQAIAFALEPGGPLLTGVIDLLAREHGGCALVIDYKTDRLAEGEDLREHVERRYALQRHIYALALLRGGAPSVEVVHWFWHRAGQPVGARFDAGDREPLERGLKQLLQAARERPFAVSSMPHRGLCETCPGRRGLCSWSDAETLRPQPPSEGSKKR